MIFCTLITRCACQTTHRHKHGGRICIYRSIYLASQAKPKGKAKQSNAKQTQAYSTNISVRTLAPKKQSASSSGRFRKQIINGRINQRTHCLQNKKWDQSGSSYITHRSQWKKNEKVSSALLYDLIILIDESCNPSSREAATNSRQNNAMQHKTNPKTKLRQAKQNQNKRRKAQGGERARTKLRYARERGRKEERARASREKAREANNNINKNNKHKTRTT